MKRRRYTNIWDAIQPSRETAANMKARSEMMIAIRDCFRPGMSLRPRQPNGLASRNRA